MAGEGRGARGDWAGSDQPMDADSQAIKGLWCWVDDEYGAVWAEGRETVGLVSHYFVKSNLGSGRRSPSIHQELRHSP